MTKKLAQSTLSMIQRKDLKQNERLLKRQRRLLDEHSEKAEVIQPRAKSRAICAANLSISSFVARMMHLVNGKWYVASAGMLPVVVLLTETRITLIIAMEVFGRIEGNDSNRLRRIGTTHS